MIQDSELWKGIKLNKSRNRDVLLLPESDNGRPVVIKRYPVEADALREYTVLANGEGDPRMPCVYDFFEREGHWYIVMEYVQGTSLRQLIEKEGPMELEKIIDIAIEILKGLRELHGRGYVHGDLHGNNVMLTRLDEPQIKIIDFQHSVKKLSTGKATAVRVIPKPHLMLAPESAIGVIDDRYDLYGVGYMCACMLAGVKLDKRLQTESFGVEAHALLKVIRKAMHKNPKKRYPSADAMIVALSHVGNEIKRHKADATNSPGSIRLAIRQPLYFRTRA